MDLFITAFKNQQLIIGAGECICQSIISEVIFLKWIIFITLFLLTMEHWKLHIIANLFLFQQLIILFRSENTVSNYIVRLNGLLHFYLLQMFAKTGSVIGILMNTDAGDKLIFTSCQDVVSR